jgi:hypothetical protein
VRQRQAEAAGAKIQNGEDYNECRGLKISRHFVDYAPVSQPTAA